MKKMEVLVLETVLKRHKIIVVHVHQVTYLNSDEIIVMFRY